MILHVVVTDAGDRVVAGLAPEAFDITEDGRRQVISFFATDTVPVDLAVLVDTSASMTNKMAALRHAAVGFLDLVRPDDRVMVVGVGERSSLLHPLDGDPRRAAQAIRHARPGGNTMLYNGLYTAMHELTRHVVPGVVRNQVLTVFSDGEDTDSIVAFEDVLERAKRANLSVYTLLLQAPATATAARERRRQSRAVFAMKDLARDTGGRAYFPSDMSELPDVYQAIARDIAGQYTLGYVSTNQSRDGGYRRVQVRLRGVAAHARTRSGYYSAAVTD